MIEFIIIGMLAGFLVIFLNYCIGKPGSEFSPYEIFSDYTVWLSKRRLKEVGLYQEYASQYNEGLRRTNTKHEVISLKNDFKKMLYNAADPFFTWERAFGMCPICFGFWISLISGLFFTKNFVYLLIIVVTSHVTIRVLNKIL